MSEPRMPYSGNTDTPTPWRVGRSVGRTIYDKNDDLIGVMDTPALATQVVRAVRDAARVPALQATAEKRATLAFGLRDIHWDTNGYCHQCGGRYPCSTIRLVNELTEAPDV